MPLEWAIVSLIKKSLSRNFHSIKLTWTRPMIKQLSVSPFGIEEIVDSVLKGLEKRQK